MGDRCADLSPSRPWCPPSARPCVWGVGHRDDPCPQGPPPPSLEVGARCHGEQGIRGQASEVTGSRGLAAGPQCTRVLLKQPRWVGQRGKRPPGTSSVLSGQQRQGLRPGWARAECGRALDTTADPPVAPSTSRPAAQQGCLQGWVRRCSRSKPGPL